MLGADAGVIKTGGYGINRSNLAVFILQEVALHAVEDAQLAVSHGCGVLGIVYAQACSLYAD